ncbi:hypothetical protein D6D25_08989, partial [Aureobasidium pullulans]
MLAQHPTYTPTTSWGQQPNSKPLQASRPGTRLTQSVYCASRPPTAKCVYRSSNAMQYVDASIIVTRSTHARHMAPVVTASPNESSSSDTNVRRIPMHDKLHYSIMPDATRLVATHQDLKATSSSNS